MSEKLSVFVCHVTEDHDVVHELCRRLERGGLAHFWVDDYELLPGQNWQLIISQALEKADAAMVCLSSTLMEKEGFVQKELRMILDHASNKPEDVIYVLPVRLDDCKMPSGLEGVQWVDYFPEDRKEIAVKKLIKSLQQRAEVVNNRRKGKSITPADLSVPPSIRDDSGRRRGIQALLPMFAVTVLAFVGLVGALLWQVLASAVSTPSPTSAPSAVILPSRTPTQTATLTLTATATSVATPRQSPTSVPPTATAPPLSPGADWPENCISSLWQPFPTAEIVYDARNCWIEPGVGGIAIVDGGLSIRATRRVYSATLQGILTPLAHRVSVNLDVSIRSISAQGELWIGIIDGADPTSQGVFFIYKSDGAFIRYVELGTNYLLSANDERLQQYNPRHLQINLTGNEIEIPVNSGYTYSRGITYVQPYLFIGYLLKPGEGLPDLDVRLTNLYMTADP